MTRTRNRLNTATCDTSSLATTKHHNPYLRHRARIHQIGITERHNPFTNRTESHRNQNTTWRHPRENVAKAISSCMRSNGGNAFNGLRLGVMRALSLSLSTWQDLMFGLSKTPMFRVRPTRGHHLSSCWSVYNSLALMISTCSVLAAAKNVACDWLPDLSSKYLKEVELNFAARRILPSKVM